jgi:hypothetical protein
MPMLPLLPAGPGSRFCRQVNLWRGGTGASGIRRGGTSPSSGRLPCITRGRYETTELAFKKLGERDRRAILKIGTDNLCANR